jgi:hypothetical protein
MKQKIPQNEDPQLQVLLTKAATGFKIHSNGASVIYLYTCFFTNIMSSEKLHEDFENFRNIEKDCDIV